MARGTAILSVRILGDATAASRALNKTAQDVQKVEQQTRNSMKAAGQSFGRAGDDIVKFEGQTRSSMKAAGHEFGRAGDQMESLAPKAKTTFTSFNASVNDLQRNLSGLVLPSAAIVGGMAYIGKKAGDLASEAEQNLGAVQAVFKEFADDVVEKSAKAAKAVGLSESNYQQFSVVVGSLIKNMGVPMEQVTGLTTGLIEKAADLASMFGGTTSEAIEAITSLLKGARDPIEKYGVSINESVLQAKMLEMGLGGLSGEAERNGKLQAVLALLNDQTADSMGNFAAEVDTTQHKQQVANATWQDASAALGDALLPALSFVADAFTDLSNFVQDHTTLTVTLMAVIGGLAAAILLVNGALRAYQAIVAIVKASIALWTAAQWLLNAALAANPIGLIVLAIAALVAGVVIAYQKFEWFKKIVDGLWESLKGAARWVGKVLGFGGQTAAVQVQTAQTIQHDFSPSKTKFANYDNIFSPTKQARTQTNVAPVQQTVHNNNITVHAFDPRASARAIKDALESLDRSTGRTTWGVAR